MKLVATFALALLLSLVISFKASHADAQLVPFYSSGSNAVYDTSTGYTSGPGKASLMGKVFGSGQAVPVADLGNGKFAWLALGYSFLAANGDQLFMVGGGTMQYIPLTDGWYYAEWSGEFTATGGTGRFSDATTPVPLSVIAINDPFQLDENGQPLEDAVWTYSWEVQGQIDLGHKKDR